MGMMSGRVAMITGAGGGIGRAAAMVFAREGARLLLCDIADDAVGRTVANVRELGGDAVAMVGDISLKTDVQGFVDRAITEWGTLDAAFNNAGITGPLHPIVDYPDEWFERTVAVNLRGTWNCIQAQVPAMLRTGGGAIVNASSCAGAVGSPGMAVYAATKHAILGLTKAVALENAAAGVRVNALLPGVIDTQQPRAFMANAPELLESLIAAMPIGRLGQAEEVAEAALWLCSDRASLVTGHGLAVDGGYLAQ
ncbi:glucose 1-dehydrogenase [Arthrobacter sp. MI7-26]|uniref:glucose 1-dehydrogenase n=1 Tax=Arthrobacter sp. MI7-26 TaxID=2993653 RepID=UPI002248F2CA|nr:glucose 1-dehydrogenase [Arthrobacter sp. MI7-26]MCX2750338.1 glucose 1-dehydrogenase [Arthrobacter sp. MI7-26]